MPTIVDICGFEFGGLSATQLVQATNGIFTAFSIGSGTFGISSTQARGTGSSFSCRCQKGGFDNYARRLIGTAGQHNIASFAVYVAQLPTNATDEMIFTCDDASTVGVIGLDNNGFFAKAISGGTKVSGSVTVTAGNWYIIDVYLNSSANPWVLKWRINGTDQTDAGFANAAVNYNGYQFGAIYDGGTASGSMEIYIDNIVYSQTPADYPLGEYVVEALVPSGEKSKSGSGTFRYTSNNGGAYTTITTTPATPGAAAVVDEWPPTADGNAADDWIEKSSGTTATDYAELDIGNPSNTGTPVCVKGYIGIQTTSTTADNIRVALVDGTTVLSDIHNATIGSSSTIFKSMPYPTGAAGAAWTLSKVQALAARMFSSDIAPVPRLKALLVEVAFPASAAPVTTPISIAASATLSPALSPLRKFYRAEAAGLTLTPTISRQAIRPRALAGALTLTGALVALKLLKRAEAATATLTPTIARTRLAVRSENAGVTLTPTLARQALRSRSVAAGITFAPTLTRVAMGYRLLAVGLTLTGALSAVKSYPRTIAGGISFTGTIGAGKAYQRAIAAGVTFTGTLTEKFMWARALAGSVTLTPALARKLSMYRSMAGSISFTNVLNRNLFKTEAGSISFTPLLSHAAIRYRSLAGSMTLTGALSLSKTWARSLAGSITFTPGLARVIPYARTMAASITFTNTLGKYFTGARVMAATVTITGALSIRKFLSFTEAVGLTLTPGMTRKMSLLRNLDIPFLISFQRTGAGVFPSGPVTFNFNEADVSPPTGWTSPGFTGAGTLTVASNQLALYSGSGALGYVTGLNLTDLDAFLTIPVLPTNGNPVGIIFRLTGEGTTTPTYYVLYSWQDATQDYFELMKYVATNAQTGGTRIGSVINQTVAAGDLFGVRAVGSTIECWYKPAAGSWSKVGQWSDTSISGSGKVGAELWFSTPRVDDFGAGAYVGGTGVKKYAFPFPGYVNFTPGFIRARGSIRPLPGSLTLTPTLTKYNVRVRSLAAGITITPTILRVRFYGRSLAGSINFSGALSLLKYAVRPMDAAINFTNIIDWRLQFKRLFPYSLDMQPQMSTFKKFYRSVPVTIALAPAMLAGKVIVKTYNVTVSLATALANFKRRPQSLDATLDTNPRMSFKRFWQFDTDINFTPDVIASIVHKYAQSLAATFTLNGNLSYNKTLGKLLSGNLGFTNAIQRKISLTKPLAATFNLSLSKRFSWAKALSAVFSVSPTLGLVFGYRKLIAASTTLSGALTASFKVGRSLASVVTLIPTLYRRQGQRLDGNLTLTPGMTQRRSGWSVILNGVINFIGNISFTRPTPTEVSLNVEIPIISKLSLTKLGVGGKIISALIGMARMIGARLGKPQLEIDTEAEVTHVDSGLGEAKLDSAGMKTEMKSAE